MKAFFYPLIISSLFLSGLLVSCNNSDTSSTNTPPVSSSILENVAQTGDTVEVDYVGKLDDGTIFDTSLQAEAKKSTDYNENRVYKPISFALGEQRMLPDFEWGIVGMKKGEKKTVRISAKNAYGETEKFVDIEEEKLQDYVTQQFEKDALSGKLTKTIPLADFQEKAATLKVGEVIKTETAQATVQKIENGQVTLVIDNPASPFYNKKITVGLTGTVDGNKVTITKIEGNDAWVKVENKTGNPFFGKKKVIGQKGSIEGSPEFEITKIADKMITLKFKNPHPLAGKDLIFDIQLQSITKAFK